MDTQKNTRDKLKFDKNIFRVFSGLQGSGKSYHATLEAYKWVKRGGTVFTNGTLDFRKHFPKLSHENIRIYDSVEDIIYFRNSLIIFDEGHIQLDSRDWKELGKKARILLSQLRKLGNKIILISQDFDRLDTIPRDLTEVIYEHHRFKKLLWWKQFLPQDIKRVKRKLIGAWFTLFDNRIAESYNCDELFGEMFLKELPLKVFEISKFSTEQQIQKVEFESLGEKS